MEIHLKIKLYCSFAYALYDADRIHCGAYNRVYYMYPPRNLGYYERGFLEVVYSFTHGHYWAFGLYATKHNSKCSKLCVQLCIITVCLPLLILMTLICSTSYRKTTRSSSKTISSC